MVVGNSCPCKDPYREIMGKCQCFTPFYFNNTQFNCVCIAEMYPDRYYQNKIIAGLQSCKKCPEGCKCSGESGCHSCESSALRQLILLEGTYSVCNDCVVYAYLSEWTCKCVDGSQPTLDGKCSCSTGIFFYEDQTSSQC